MADGLGLDGLWDEPYYRAAKGSFSTKGAFILRKLLKRREVRGGDGGSLPRRHARPAGHHEV